MLCFGDRKIVHATLHRSVSDAIAMITREKIPARHSGRRPRAQSGSAWRPAFAVGGLNPHAGEGGLFGCEEIDIIAPAMRTPPPPMASRQRPVRRRHHVSHARASTPSS